MGSLERTAAAVYFTCSQASRVRRRGRSTASRYPAASSMTATDTSEAFAALDRLIAASDGFVSAWGVPDAAMLERLEAFAGYRLPDDFRAFTLRYGNAHV